MLSTPLATIKSSPRLLPEFRAEAAVLMRRMARIAVLSGPPLALVAWWLVYRLDPSAAPAAFFWKLFTASLAMPLMLLAYMVPLWHPRWGRLLLPKWEVWEKGLMLRSRAFVPWRDLSPLRVEPADGVLAETELVLHVTALFRGKTISFSLPCLKTEVDQALIERIASAIRNQHWPRN